MDQKRREAGFFEWLPAEKGPLRQFGTPWRKGKQSADFILMNHLRALGPDWRNLGRAGCSGAGARMAGPVRATEGMREHEPVLIIAALEHREHAARTADDEASGEGAHAEQRP